MSEYATDQVEKVHAPPLVQDATHPDASADDDAGPKTGALIGLVGMPNDGDFAQYDAALGYFVPVSIASLGVALSPVTVDDGMGGFEIVFDEDGNVVYA